MSKPIAPQPGPQTAFATTPADVAIFGGSAGSGKTNALVRAALRGARVPGYAAVIFRRTQPELRGGGSVWEESVGIYPAAGGKAREHNLEWRFPSGATVKFNHLQHAKDVHQHQGKQYAAIFFDELTHFLERQFWYLVSRNRSTCGIRPFIRATTNPDPDSWVRKLVDWWIGPEGFPIPERSGVVRWLARDGDEIRWADTEDELLAQGHPQPMSFTFIPAKLSDNPALTTKDPQYIGRLMSLPTVERERLLHGNWDIRAARGLMFRPSQFELVDAVPADAQRIRGWDFAATAKIGKSDPDYTVGVKLSRTNNGVMYIEHVERLRADPAGVEAAVVNTANIDGTRTQVALWEDPGAAGKAIASHFARLLNGYTVHTRRAAKDKVSYANPWSAQAEAGNIKIVRGHWNGAYLAELEAFPVDGHDDQVDATSLAYQILADRNLDALRGLAKWK